MRILKQKLEKRAPALFKNDYLSNNESHVTLGYIKRPERSIWNDDDDDNNNNDDNTREEEPPGSV